MNCRLLTAVVVLVCLAAPTFATESKLPPTLKIAKQELQLNGEGIRQKYMLDLYCAGLYLTKPNREDKVVVAADELMAIRVAITSKFVSQDKLIASLDEGFNRSTKGNVKPIQIQIDQFQQCFSEKIVRGDVFDFVYVPNQGVMVFKNGKNKGSVAGLPFKQALFGVWLGEQPADAKLKIALLGTEREIQRR